MNCDNCAINREVDVSPEYAVCAWYMDNVVLGNKTTDDCPLYKEVKNV